MHTGRRGRLLFLSFEERASESPFVDRVWRSWSGAAGRFVSVATSSLEIVIGRVQGRAVVSVRGPEPRPSLADCPADGAWVAIRFRPGVYLRELPSAHLIAGGGAVHRPLALDGRFPLLGGDFEAPSFDNAEGLVARLARSGMLARDEAVAAALEADDLALSPRSLQRRFLRATGMPFARVRQIQRARQAAVMLRQGASILDATYASGYFDQAHLTRSLRAFIGQTPAMIARGEAQLSFLYKTDEGPGSK